MSKWRDWNRTFAIFSSSTQSQNWILPLYMYPATRGASSPCQIQTWKLRWPEMYRQCWRLVFGWLYCHFRIFAKRGWQMLQQEVGVQIVLWTLQNLMIVFLFWKRTSMLYFAIYVMLPTVNMEFSVYPEDQCHVFKLILSHLTHLKSAFTKLFNNAVDLKFEWREFIDDQIGDLYQKVHQYSRPIIRGSCTIHNLE